MDYEKYYKIMPDGTYCIHFPNKKGLSKEEINNMFSPYGNILNISWKGDITNGLIFIKYKTLREILYCLKNLLKSNDIRILPQKNKIGKQKIQENSNEWQTGRTDNSIRETFVIDKQHYSNTTYDNKISIPKEKITYRRNSDYDDNGDNDCDDFSISNSLKSKHDSKFHINTINSEKLNSSHVDEERSQFPKQQNYNHKVPSCDQVTKQTQEVKFYGPSKLEVMSYSIRDKDTFNNGKTPLLISDSEIIPEKSDIKINHSTCANNTFHKSIVTMQEVIVANIHVNYGVHYILHLFEKHNPISATFVKTIFKTNIRYCFVYFLKIEDALAIEKEFDNFVLAGRNLIVLQRSQLNKAICK